jgi:hypothetical protein
VSQTSAQRRARGLQRLEIWLDAKLVRTLDQICEDSGYTRADVIRGYIESEAEEWRQVRASARRKKTPAAQGNGG